MTVRSITVRNVNRLKDEVYRQMLRLEMGRPAADVLLAIAVLQAWIVLERQPPECESRLWLRRMSLVCLNRIRQACESGCASCIAEDLTEAESQAPHVKEK